MSSSQTAGGSRDARRGALFGLVAAALFGVSAPLAKRLLGEMTPQILAGLLYLGAGIALSAWRALRPVSREAPLTRRDVPALAGIVIAGGILGPLLMLIGLQRVNAVAGSLLLNLEGPFTIALAVLLFREHLSKGSVIAALLIFAGAAVLKLETGEAVLDPWGVAAIAAACFAWALDNNLTQRISLRDPVAIVRIKALVAGSFNLALGLAHHATSGLPSMSAVAGACVLGAFSYGVSVVLDAYALRLIGAAREAMYFATAPFVGAIAATWIVREALRPVDIVAMCSMALGVAALVRERHSHRHTHDPIEHDHLHVHDEHHQHAHGPDITTAEPHAHAHKHDALVHSHPHVPDAHHRHRH